jgi:hypothetical protein
VGEECRGRNPVRFRRLKLATLRSALPALPALVPEVSGVVGNANYTSVYPRMSLAPEQRFVSRGAYIARLSEDGRLVAVSDWLIPGSN